ncbi:hypothetical protein EI94DRAFT_1567532, partial [Lactarius quietus]
GKRIAIPVRIEPKVYFATERTSLKWLPTAIYIETIATTLLKFIPPHDERGLLCVSLFTFATLFAIVYSAGIFVYRAMHLRGRGYIILRQVWSDYLSCVSFFLVSW